MKFCGKIYRAQRGLHWEVQLLRPLQAAALDKSTKDEELNDAREFLCPMGPEDGPLTSLKVLSF